METWFFYPIVAFCVVRTYVVHFLTESNAAELCYNDSIMSSV